MSKNRKRATTLAAAGAVVAVAIGGGVAYAAFARSKDAGPVVKSESFGEFEVSGSLIAASDGSTALLPGEVRPVELVLQMPTNSVNARVTSIMPVTIASTSVTGLSDQSKASPCASKITLAKYANTGLVLPKTAGGIKVQLNDAVTFAQSAGIECQGMTFPTNFKVTIEATRDAANTGSSTAINPSAVTP